MRKSPKTTGQPPAKPRPTTSVQPLPTARDKGKEKGIRPLPSA